MTAARATSLLAFGLAALAGCASGDPLGGGGDRDAGLLDAGAGADAPPAPDASSIEALVINEFVFNHTGADDNEYLEVAGPPGADFTGATLLVIEGDANAAPGQIVFVEPVGEPTGGLFVTDFFAGALQNGSQTLLLVDGFTGSVGDDLDMDDDGAFDDAPWSLLLDAIAVDDGDAGDPSYARVVLGPDYDGLGQTVAGASRIPDGLDTDQPGDWVRNDFDGDGLACCAGAAAASGEAFNTPGAANAVQD